MDRTVGRLIDALRKDRRTRSYPAYAVRKIYNTNVRSYPRDDQMADADVFVGRSVIAREGDEAQRGYFLCSRSQRVFFRSFLCFFLRIFLRRFLSTEPISTFRLSSVRAQHQPQVDALDDLPVGRYPHRPEPKSPYPLGHGRQKTQRILAVLKDT